MKKYSLIAIVLLALGFSGSSHAGVKSLISKAQQFQKECNLFPILTQVTLSTATELKDSSSLFEKVKELATKEVRKKESDHVYYSVPLKLSDVVSEQTSTCSQLISALDKSEEEGHQITGVQIQNDETNQQGTVFLIQKKTKKGVFHLLF